MSPLVALEQRLEALERVVASIQHGLLPPTNPGRGVKSLIGSMKDSVEFKEILEYGKRFRQGNLDADNPDSRESADA